MSWTHRIVGLLTALATVGCATLGPHRAPTPPSDPPVITLQVPVHGGLTDTYALSPDDLVYLRRMINTWMQRPLPTSPDVLTRYSDDITWGDGWLPEPGTPLTTRPTGDHHEWTYVNGRVTQERFIAGGRPASEWRVWYSSFGAPVLSVQQTSTYTSYTWADYDADHMLRRVVRLSGDWAVLDVSVFDNTPSYDSTIHRQFTRDGRQYVRTDYTGDQVKVTTRDGAGEKIVNLGSRRWWLCRLQKYGLASIYPIPVTDAHIVAAAMNGTRQRLAITRLDVDPPTVEKQCTGNIYVYNAGKSYEHDPNTIGLSWVLTIRDQPKRAIYRAGGGWPGGLPTGSGYALTFDTHANALPEAKGKPFLFPEPGSYYVTVQLFAAETPRTPLDTWTVSVVVPPNK